HEGGRMGKQLGYRTQPTYTLHSPGQAFGHCL
ncbi:hypothetical protein DYADSP32_1422, partial [Dyadobacter sp. 32]